MVNTLGHCPHKRKKMTYVIPGYFILLSRSIPTHPLPTLLPTQQWNRYVYKCRVQALSTFPMGVQYASYRQRLLYRPSMCKNATGRKQIWHYVRALVGNNDRGQSSIRDTIPQFQGGDALASTSEDTDGTLLLHALQSSLDGAGVPSIKAPRGFERQSCLVGSCSSHLSISSTR